MEIKTKYNIGDEVWYKSNYRERKALITHIEIYRDGIYYELDREDYIYFESELFPTKEELLTSL